MIWNGPGIGGGTALIVLCALYFVVKWAVHDRVQKAHARMDGGRPAEQGVGRQC